MPALDPEDEIIVAAYVANGSNQVEAWRVGHPNSRATPKSQHETASKFFRQAKVRSRIVELHAEVAAKLSDDAALTVKDHMEKLRELRDVALQRGQLSAAISAEVKRGEVKRFYIRQAETGTPGEFDRMSLEELRDFVYGDTAEVGTKH